MQLSDLIQVPFNNRDHKWENRFFKALTESNLKLLNSEAQSGPDGWPYLLTEISSQATEPTQKIIQWLSTKGIGLVINPQKEYPDFVFSYGMLWFFRETGLFYQQAKNKSEGTVEFSSQTIRHSGNPTNQFLPSYVRSILKEFLQAQGILCPKILAISIDNEHYDLAFSLEYLGNPPENEHQGIAEAISWFLPPHYSIMLISERGLPSFFDL